MTKGRGASMTVVKSVWFNSGSIGGERLFALVIEDKGDDKLDLAVIGGPEGVQVVSDVPRLEVKKYGEDGPAGNGGTWHSG